MIILKKLIRHECCIEENTENLGYKKFEEAIENIEQTIKEMQIDKNDFIFED